LEKAGELDRVSALLDGGASWRPTWEEFLRELPEDQADALMLLAKEGRGAWTCLLNGNGGRALFLGNALSGTVVALAAAGFEVTVMDPVAERLRFGIHRNRELAPEQTKALVAQGTDRLPFEQHAFDLVVQEDGLPNPAAGWGHSLQECRRVCGGELLLCADNRLAYKRSSGLRGDFPVPRPLAWLRRALGPAPGEHTLPTYRRLVQGPEFRAPRAFSLYPHSRDFTHLVGLDGTGPALAVGPQERKNPAKVLARAAGLFPWLTPSFAVVTERRAARLEKSGPRIERILAQLGQHLAELAPGAGQTPQVEHLIASRSNTAVLHTAIPGAAPEESAGRWTLHIPQSPQKRHLCSRHMSFLARVRRDFPQVPVPQPLFEGELEGLWFVCERRLAGLTAPQLTGDQKAMERMYADAARQLAALANSEARPLHDEEYEELIGARFRLVAERCGRRETVRELRRMEAALGEVLRGTVLRRVLYHADVRSKHLQVKPTGEIIGYLDWGASEERFLPLVDLLHLLVHQRKQESGCSPRAAWELVRSQNLRPHERAALDEYSERLALSTDYRQAIENAWPALVAGMAEMNWDYSRPLWVHREYGL
jgi:aminoglycoside phosphotransferase (APT) family kinase protein